MEDTVCSNWESKVKDGTCVDFLTTMQRLWYTQCIQITQHIPIGNRQRLSNKISLRRSLDEIACYLQDNQLAINLPKNSLTECMLKQKRGWTPGEPPSLLVEKEPGDVRLVEDSNYLSLRSKPAGKSWLAETP